MVRRAGGTSTRTGPTITFPLSSEPSGDVAKRPSSAPIHWPLTTSKFQPWTSQGSPGPERQAKVDLLWDDDGQAYLVHGWAQSRIGVKNRLTVHRMSPDAGRGRDR